MFVRHPENPASNNEHRPKPTHRRPQTSTTEPEKTTTTTSLSTTSNTSSTPFEFSTNYSTSTLSTEKIVIQVENKSSIQLLIILLLLSISITGAYCILIHFNQYLKRNETTSTPKTVATGERNHQTSGFCARNSMVSSEQSQSDTPVLENSEQKRSKAIEQRHSVDSLNSLRD